MQHHTSTHSRYSCKEYWMIQVSVIFIDWTLRNLFLKNENIGESITLSKVIRKKMWQSCPHLHFSLIQYLINNFKSDIDRYIIGSLMWSTEEYCMPNMLRSWDFTKYIHTCDHLYLDIFIQLQFCDSYLIITNIHANYRFIESTRDDYTRDISDYGI